MNQARHIAALSTIAIAALVGLWLCLSHLSWSPDKEWPPQPEPYIELAEAEELFETMPLPPATVPSRQQQDAAAQTPEDMDNPARLAPETGTALEDHVPAGKPAPVVTSNRPSDVQTEKKEQPEKTGTPADKKAKEEQTTARRTQSTVSNAFSNARHNANNGKGDTGNAGRANGNPASAGPANSTSSSVGVSHGRISGGWRFPGYSNNIPSNKVGKVRIEALFDAGGNVTQAKVIGGEGNISESTKEACLREVRRHKFARKGTDTANADGGSAIITFVFKDKTPS